MSTPLHLLFLIIVPLLVSGTEEDHSVKHVVELTTENFDEEIKNYLFSSVMFFAPWCGHCKNLMPVYDQFCKDVQEKEHNVLCSRVNCDEHKDICKKYGVTGYPTLLRFVGEKSCTYSGERDLEGLKNWYTRTLSVLKDKSDNSDLEKYKGKSGQMAIVGFFEEPSSGVEDLLVTATCDAGSTDFLLIRHKNIASEFDIKDQNGVYVIKNGSVYKKYEGSEDDSLALGKFLFLAIQDIVPEYSIKNSQAVFSSYYSKYATLIFDSKDSASDEILKAVEEVANSYLDNIRFFKTDISSADSKNVVDYFKVKKFPTFCLYDDESGSFYHYDESELTSDKLHGFIKRFLVGEVEAYRSKQPVPDAWEEAPIKTLVVDNFEIALSKGKDVVVLFYAPWCGHCKAIKPIWEKLGEHFKENDSVWIGQMDATENDMPSLKIQGYPTIKVFRKNGDVSDYLGGRTFDDILDYITGGFISTPETKKEKTPDDSHEDL